MTPDRRKRLLAAKESPVVVGPTATFLWRGEADAVRLLCSVYGLPSSQDLVREPGTDLWTLDLELPEGSRVEYRLEVFRDGERHEVLDPMNPNRARNPFGEHSVCRATGYAMPDWTLPDPEARPGTVEEIIVPSRALGRDERVRLYLPARFRRTRRYPLLIVHDGFEFVEYAALQVVLDNLIHRMEIAPLVVALTHPVDRLVQYADHEPHARYLAEELVPTLERDWPLHGRPGARGLMGASFGAVAALSAAWRNPGTFGRLFLLSGSFAFTDIGKSHRGPAFDPVVEFVNRFRKAPGRPAERVFVTCGLYESLIYENRSLVPLLNATGMDVKYTESRDGHMWENWRDRLRSGLSWLFPGPLWMVYE